MQTCPLCRYYTNPQQLNHCDDCGVTDNYFEQLMRTDDLSADLRQYTLWTCLVCGHIGCFNLMSRLQQEEKTATSLVESVQQGHSFDHYVCTKHVYAMEIETKKVWDFSKENFVNRLIQNEIDGKLVEVGEYSGEAEFSTQIDSSSKDIFIKSSKNVHIDSVFQFNKKIESLNHEYNSILIKTLENQREYYKD